MALICTPKCSASTSVCPAVPPGIRASPYCVQTDYTQVCSRSIEHDSLTLLATDGASRCIARSRILLRFRRRVQTSACSCAPCCPSQSRSRRLLTLANSILCLDEEYTMHTPAAPRGVHDAMRAMAGRRGLALPGLEPWLQCLLYPG